MARRGRLVAVAALCSLALTTAVVTVNGPRTAPNRTPLATGPGWRIDGASSIEGGSAGSAAATGDDQEWLAAGVVPGAGTRWASMVRFAMIDLHQLTRGNGAVAAGAAARWGYAWPRDMAFVAVAMARTGHRPDALRMLTFLQRVQAADGGFEARYRLDGSGPPDDRPGQSDGAGWALWAMGEVLRAGTTPPGAADLRPLRALLDRSSSYAAADRGRRPAAAATVPGLLGGAGRPHQPRHGRPHAGRAPGQRPPVRRARRRAPLPTAPGPPRRGWTASCGARSPPTATSASAGTAVGTRRSRSSCRRSPTRPDRASNGRGSSTSERPCARPAGWRPVRSGRRTARPGPRRPRWSPTPPPSRAVPRSPGGGWTGCRPTSPRGGACRRRSCPTARPRGPPPLAWSAAAVVLAVARLEADGPAAIR